MRHACFLLLLFFCHSSFDLLADTLTQGAQPHNRYHKSLALYQQAGTVIQTHAFVKGDNPHNEAYGGYYSLSLKYGIHTDGRKDWQQLYGYPVWGIGLYKAFFFNDYDELGNPAAAYIFLNLPLKRWKR